MERLSLYLKEEGFTLVEMLIVILIVLSVVFLSYFHVRSSYENNVIQQFIEMLQEDIWLAQHYAISHSQSVELTFYAEQGIYDLRESGLRKLIYKRPVHSDIRIRPLTLSNPVKFLPNGNINQPGTLYVHYQNKTYKLIFQLGRGRFRVEKQ